MSTVSATITRADDGRRMSMDEYLAADIEDGLLCELGRGVLTVIEVPNWKHLRQLSRIRKSLFAYWEKFPTKIVEIAMGSECRLPIESLESDRHPDLAIYCTPRPDVAPADEFWSLWIPDIVIEVVSPGSVQRDYEEKPEEYRQFAVREYWVVDSEKGEMLVHRRLGGRWKTSVVRPGELYKTPLLPGLEFDLAAVFVESDS